MLSPTRNRLTRETLHSLLSIKLERLTRKERARSLRQMIIEPQENISEVDELPEIEVEDRAVQVDETVDQEYFDKFVEFEVLDLLPPSQEPASFTSLDMAISGDVGMALLSQYPVRHE